MENIENDFPIKRFGKVAIDIIAFAALAVILVTIMSIPFSVLFLKTDKESPDSMFVFMLSETLMLIGVFLSAWIVWHFRGLSLAGFIIRSVAGNRSLCSRLRHILIGRGGRDYRSYIQSFFPIDQLCFLLAGSRYGRAGIAGLCTGTDAARRDK